MENRRNRVALITGASSGIGCAFARQLAAQGYNLILTARRQDRLMTLAADLQQQYPITAECLVADLSRSGGIKQLEQRIGEQSTIDMLVNNAGFGTMGAFAEIDLGKQLEMVQVHIIATMRLCRAALAKMLAQHRGAIINVASIGGFLPAPGNVTYNATKAYLLSFTESLQMELRGTGVQVQVLCPGFTHTEFHANPEYADFDRSQIPRWLWSSAEQVVAESLRALASGQVICIPAFKNRLLIALYRNRLTALLLRARAEAIVKKAIGIHRVT